jgi:Fe(3+) dicitrate transport protein
MFKRSLFATVIVLVNQSANSANIEEITIIGAQTDAQRLPSSAYVVDEQELRKFEYTDINRMVRQIPGVYLQEEDGFGLRPNIGIRGAGSERSAKITLMEDGVLIAPAPYSAPAAYYFPVVGRMSGIEVLKGANILRHGPSTVAGVVNLISTRIPDQSSGQINLEAGEFNSHRVKANYGNSGENWGLMAQTYQQKSDGFKTIDRTDGDSGFNIEDYVVKARVNSADETMIYHQLDMKLQYSEEIADETYVGLTDIDFDADGNRRYGLTELDQMKTRHSGANLRYQVKFNEQFSLTSITYYNKFKRDWFKVDKIDGSSIANVVDDANNGDQNALGILNGNIDSQITLKHNNREYLSKGIQLLVDWAHKDHQLQAGIRYHEDEVDRFQPTEAYQQTNGELVFDDIIEPNASNNRVEKSEALALHLMDVWSVNQALDLTLGLRFEDIKSEQRRYSNVNRSSSDIAAQNTVDELLWSVGITYHLNHQWQVLAGGHSGFSPASPGSQENVAPEKSTNFEAGTRFKGDILNLSAIVFYSDYKNKITNCSIAFPCGVSTSGSESEGEAVIQGLEFTVGSSLYQNSALSIPLTLSYTFTKAKITDAAQSGNQKGDVLPYVPENVWNAQVGFEFVSGWDTYVSASYIDKMCVDNSCERNDINSTYQTTDDMLIFDIATHYPINDVTSVYLKVDNLLDAQDIVARSPGGARPSKPRTATLGFKISF